MLSFELRHVARLPCFQLVSLRGFRYSGGANRGFEEFFEVTKPNEVKTFGRAWTAEDLRRKVISATNFVN